MNDIAGKITPMTFTPEQQQELVLDLCRIGRDLIETGNPYIRYSFHDFSDLLLAADKLDSLSKELRCIAASTHGVKVTNAEGI
jgi:hypothetical protein